MSDTTDAPRGRARGAILRAALATAAGLLFWLLAAESWLLESVTVDGRLLGRIDLGRLGPVFLALAVGLAVASFFMWRRLLRERRHSRRERQENVEHFAALVRAIPDIIYELDTQGRFTFVSGAIRTLGYEPEELIGEHFSRIVHPEDLETVSRATVLLKYKGRTTGDAGAPKLFDERRTGRRATRNLRVRLVPKGRSPARRYGEIHSSARWRPREDAPETWTAYCQVDSAGKWSEQTGSKPGEFLGSIGIIRDVAEDPQPGKTPEPAGAATPASPCRSRPEPAPAAT